MVWILLASIALSVASVAILLALAMTAPRKVAGIVTAP